MLPATRSLLNSRVRHLLQSQTMKERKPARASAEEINILASLINNISVVGSQLLAIRCPEAYENARRNLKMINRDFSKFAKRLDALGSQTNDRRIGRFLNDVGRLLNDIEKTPSDAAGILSLANQCFVTVAFLSHCLVVGAPMPGPEPFPVQPPVGVPMCH